ncbi:MAG: hypothetical protein ACREB5_12020 [Sphingomonadaceae bacterium]
MITQRRFKKGSIGATSVTLDPSTAGGTAENKPGHLVMSQIVVSTGGATPDAYFWGTAAADGKEYLVTIERI